MLANELQGTPTGCHFGPAFGRDCNEADGSGHGNVGGGNEGNGERVKGGSEPLGRAEGFVEFVSGFVWSMEVDVSHKRWRERRVGSWRDAMVKVKFDRMVEREAVALRSEARAGRLEQSKKQISLRFHDDEE